MSALQIPRVFLAILLLLSHCWSKGEAPIVCKDTTELQQRIEKVLLENKVPGACVALADRNGVSWVAGIGKCDVASGRAATPDTLFRVGSISKIWVGLAALKLQGEGRLNLQAPLRSLVPELQFENPWEGTHPVRLIHLLEHTAGWDDLRLREYASSDPKPLSLKEGLDFDPRSRTSRWRPGTSFSYSNSGSAAVAYVIQKITGQDYEQYVAENFFRPMGMYTSSFRLNSEVEPQLTKLYGEDGRTPIPYYHDLMRPVGALNTSAREMGNFLLFLLNRGTFAGKAVLPARALDQRETPSTGYGPQAGMRIGYSLCNEIIQGTEGFIWHGHSGGLPGSLSRLAYLPEAGIGYFVSINANSGKASGAIRKLLRAYLTKDLPHPAKPPIATLPPSVGATYQGWYVPASPRNQRFAFLDYLGVTRVRVQGSQLILNTVLGDKSTLVAVSDTLFREEHLYAASIALLPPGPEGIQFVDDGLTIRRISSPLAWTILFLTGLFLLSFLGTILFALIWIPRLIFRRMKGVRHLSLRAWPLLASLSLLAAVLLFAMNLSALMPLAKFSLVSLGLCLLTLLFAFASVAGLTKALFTSRVEVKNAVWIQSLLASGTFTLVAIFLAWHGVIGIRTWN